MVSGAAPLHPSEDLLADLVADALPTADARAVEAHVMECARCSGLLADAEHVRAMLVRHDPGPMPADVVARIEAALHVEATTLPADPGYPEPAPPTAPQPLQAPTAWSDTTTIEAFESVMSRRGRRESRPPEPPLRAPTGDWSDTPTTDAPAARSSRFSRPTRGSSRSRRDLRQEVREVKAGRRGTVLLGAAAVVLVVTLGGFAVRGFVTSSRSPSEASAGSEAALSAPSGPPVVSTGTDYTDAKLAAQTHALVNRVTTTDSAPAAQGAQATAGVRSAVSPAATAAATGNQALRSPSALQGCLSALQARNEQPVAVDLSTYEGQDAAVIVLLTDSGGYEVWVVARTCQPGNDGTLKYLQLPS